MKKLLINRRPVDGPWGGGNHFVRAIFENGLRNGFEVVSELGHDIDAILVMDPRYDELGISINEIAAYKAAHPHTKIIHRVNECDRRKGETNQIDPLLRGTSRISDLSIFISFWLEEHHRSMSWFCDNSLVIYNGTHKSNIKPHKMNKGILALGGVQDPVRLVTHHWSNNKLKGFDIYDKLDAWVKNNDRFTFTYIGRDRGTFKNTRVIQPKFGSELTEVLYNNDVYISASRWDPGPNHIVESLACVLPTFVHVDGGGAVEMAGWDHVYRSFEELVSILETRNYSQNAGIDVRTWSDVADDYFNAIKSVL